MMNDYLLIFEIATAIFNGLAMKFSCGFGAFVGMATGEGI